MVEAIGRCVVELACEQLAQLGSDVWVSLNVSARELTTPALAATIAATLDRRGTDPSCLLVEVTESAFIADGERANATMALLRTLAVRLAIDDFGAVYSSLSRLRELPVDVLKIDAAFLRGVPDDAAASSMLGAVVQFALTLGLTPSRRASRLRSSARRWGPGCPLAQGYHFGRPAPLDHWLGAGRVHPAA